MGLFGGKPNIKKLKAKKDVKGLIKSLKNKDKIVRKRAIKALVDLRKISAEPLIQYLKHEDENEDIIAGAILSLGMIGKPAVNLLIQALQTVNEKTIGRITYTLGIMGKPAVKPLINALKHEDWRIRVAAALALGWTGDKRAVEPLTDLLKDKNEAIRLAADEALNKIKMKEKGGVKMEVVKIGKQEWMAKNLEVDHFRNGDPIPQVQDSDQWKNLTTAAWCYYKNDPANGTKYGKLYNWYAVNDPRGLAPEGWHLPTDEEWKTLLNHLGGEKVAGGKMKQKGTAHWHSPNTGATNESGFSALPGGYRVGDNGIFGLMGDGATFWSSSTYHPATAVICGLDSDYSEFWCDTGYKHYGYSVRCVKD